MKTKQAIFKTTISIITCLVLSQGLFAQDGTGNCGARIEIKVDNSIVTLTGYFKNKSNEQVLLDYELIVNKNSGTNHSANNQSGKIIVQPGDEKPLSVTKVNFTESDVIDFELRIIHEGKVVCLQKGQYPQSSPNN